MKKFLEGVTHDYIITSNMKVQCIINAYDLSNKQQETEQLNACTDISIMNDKFIMQKGCLINFNDIMQQTETVQCIIDYIVTLNQYGTYDILNCLAPTIACNFYSILAIDSNFSDEYMLFNVKILDKKNRG